MYNKVACNIHMDSLVDNLESHPIDTKGTILHLGCDDLHIHNTHFASSLLIGQAKQVKKIFCETKYNIVQFIISLVET